MHRKKSSNKRDVEPKMNGQPGREMVPLPGSLLCCRWRTAGSRMAALNHMPESNPSQWAIEGETMHVASLNGWPGCVRGRGVCSVGREPHGKNLQDQDNSKVGTGQLLLFVVSHARPAKSRLTRSRRAGAGRDLTAREASCRECCEPEGAVY
jgi:hypothetical protein